jgi:hypothetical protein
VAEADEFLELRFAHDGVSKRRLTFVAHGERYEKIVQKFKRSIRIPQFRPTR